MTRRPSRWQLAPADLVAGVRAGNKRALERVVTPVENADPRAAEVIRSLCGDAGRAATVGITGSPGVGKSILVAALVAQVRAEDRSVGVISVDPWSTRASVSLKLSSAQVWMPAARRTTRSPAATAEVQGTRPWIRLFFSRSSRRRLDGCSCTSTF